MAAMAGSLALSLALVSGPVALAQDAPTDTIQGFADALEAKEFESLSSYFCEEQAEQVGQFDMSELTAELGGLDAASLLDAFNFDVQIDSMEVLSETDIEAVVDLTGSVAMDIDVEKLTPFITAILESFGAEVTPELVEEMTAQMIAEMGDVSQAEDISAEITLVPGEAMAWLICSDLGMDDDDATEDFPATEGDAESPAPTAE
jgi:hypothetical protein